MFGYGYVIYILKQNVMFVSVIQLMHMQTLMYEQFLFLSLCNNLLFTLQEELCKERTYNYSSYTFHCVHKVYKAMNNFNKSRPNSIL